MEKPSLWSMIFGRGGEKSRENEAVLLDMGEYMFIPKGQEVPDLLTATDIKMNPIVETLQLVSDLLLLEVEERDE